MSRRRPVLLPVLVLALIAGACDGAAAPGPPGPSSPSPSPAGLVEIAFVQDLTGPNADPDVTSALQAVELAVANAALGGDLPADVGVVPFDTGGDPARAAELVAEIAADEAFVAVIGAPFLDGQAALGDALAAEGVPWVALSDRGAELGRLGWPAFRRFVQDEGRVGHAIATSVDGLADAASGVCLLGDGSPGSVALLAAVRAALDAPVLLRAAVADDAPGQIAEGVAAVGGAGCGAVVWGGDAGAGAELRRALVDAGLDGAFVGGDRMKSPAFLDAVGPAGRGSIATCPCVDLSTSTDLAALRFIQDYQAEFGLPPGPYAAEAWDAARLLIQALRGGADGREGVAAALAATLGYEGLAGSYRFGDGGDLTPGSMPVRRYRDAGGRWIEVTEDP
jgi:branched-chain amino acid transport system substrate-binding protein